MSTARDESPSRSRLAEDDDVIRVWRDRIDQALDAKKPQEPIWRSNLYFAAGKFWIEYDRFTRQFRHVSETDARFRDTELYTANVLREYRAAALGELHAEDARPELLLAQAADRYDEEIQRHLNRAVQHGWDHEWKGDDTLLDLWGVLLDFGVGAIRVRFDAGFGKKIRDGQENPVLVPYRDGAPVFGEDARAYVAEMQESGRTADLREVNEGRITWEIGSPFNILACPGVIHERDFPWEGWVKPVLLTTVKDEYPAARGLKEDTDIGSIGGLTSAEVVQFGTVGDGTRARLRDHVWLFTMFEKPSRRYEKGRTIVFAGKEKRLIDIRDELPYQAPDGCWRSGITYFHYWRRTDSFWSTAMIEPLKDPQRIINRRKTQNVEIIDRGMPYVIVEEGMLPEKPAGDPMEYVELKRGGLAPVPVQGVGPGTWMQADIEGLREDLAHASTISDIRLGENPTNADTYSALARLDELEQSKRRPIVAGTRVGIKQLVEDSVYDIRRYWRPDKQLLISGDDDRLEAVAYGQSRIPDFFMVKVAKGTAKPRSQAAELQKIEDIKNAAIAAAVFDQKWVQWYRDSLDAGQVLELPEMAGGDEDVAEMENHLLAAGGEPPVAYWQNMAAHVAVHRQAQDKALLSGDHETLDRIEEHIQAHKEIAVATVVPSAAEPAAEPLEAAAVEPGGEIQ